MFKDFISTQVTNGHICHLPEHAIFLSPSFTLVFLIQWTITIWQWSNILWRILKRRVDFSLKSTWKVTHFWKKNTELQWPISAIWCALSINQRYCAQDKLGHQSCGILAKHAVVSCPYFWERLVCLREIIWFYCNPLSAFCYPRIEIALLY